MKGKERGERPEAMGEENHTTEKERQAAKKETRVKKKKRLIMPTTRPKLTGLNARPHTHTLTHWRTHTNRGRNIRSHNDGHS